MREKFYKNLLAAVIIMLVVAPVFTLALPAQAADANELLWGNQENNVAGNLGLGNKDPRAIMAGIINIALGFLGIVAVVIIILGGFKWMTAGGNEDKVSESKKLITAGIIGMVIVLAAWGIATFVINQLYNATGANVAT